jgi:hypothetical protein
VIGVSKQGAQMTVSSHEIARYLSEHFLTRPSFGGFRPERFDPWSGRPSSLREAQMMR